MPPPRVLTEHKFSLVITEKITAEMVRDFLDNLREPQQRQRTLSDSLARQWKGGMPNGSEKFTTWTQIPKKPGVYAVFITAKNAESKECFYVGMSASNVHGRIVRHLRNNTKDKYRGWEEILKRKYVTRQVCYAEVKPGRDRDATRQALELLEACLTVKLRPKYLTNLARFY